MPKRIEKRFEKDIGNYQIGFYSKAHGDIFKVMQDIHSDYKFGILLADIIGHEQVSGIEKKLLTETSNVWYKEPTASKAIQNLCEKINERKGKKYDLDSVDKLQMSTMLYLLFKENSINYANSAMTNPILIQKGNLKELNEKSLPLGFFQYKKTNEVNFKEGESLILYTDGLIENPLICKKAKERINKIEEKIKKELSKKIDTLNIENKVDKVYQESLMEIVKNNPEKSIEELKKIIFSKNMKEYTPKANKKIGESFEQETIKIKGERDTTVINIQKEIQTEFSEKFIGAIKENYTKTPKEMINGILELGEYFIPTKEHHDDVTILIIKKVA